MSTPVSDPASLQNLHGIVPPPPVPWWPPAAGWYVLAGIFLMTLLLGLILWLRRYRRNRYRREALTRLQQIRSEASVDTMAAADELAALLKQTALAAWPRGAVASLNGSDWLNFLSRTTPQTNSKDDLGHRLYTAVYQQEALDESQFQALCARAEAWIRQHRAGVN